MTHYPALGGNVSDEPKSNNQEPLQPLCEKCGGALELAASIPKALGDPAYKIFKCVICDVLHWLVQPNS
jgi:hypothetical protein